MWLDFAQMDIMWRMTVVRNEDCGPITIFIHQS